MDNVRPNKDIAIYENNGVIWVEETLAEGQLSGVISTFTIQGNGKNWWKINAGIEIPPELELIDDRSNHWLWKPYNTMRLEQYQMALKIVGNFFL
jgi:hypothetical protein